MNNPYAPPEAKLDKVTEDSLDNNLRLHSLWNIVIATIIGSSIAGIIILANNYKHLNQYHKRRKILQFGFPICFVATIVEFYLPEDYGLSYAGLAAHVIAVVILTRIIQYPTISKHQANGGKMISAWSAVGTGIQVLIVMVGVIIGLEILVEFFAPEFYNSFLN